MTAPYTDDRSLLRAILGDGRPLLLFTGLCLMLSGAFALFLSAMGQFLPHDVQFLGMTAQQLCSQHACRIVHFMFHDRVSFGGSLIAIGALYMWLVEFPLRHKQAWAWWLLVLTGVVGFSSFLAYLGYGYLDTWHGVATLLLLPCFVTGLFQAYAHLPPPVPLRSLARQAVPIRWTSPFGIGRACLLLTAAGMMLAGSTIVMLGMTRVFVPQDLAYMGVRPADLQAINPHLIPLIAHDRAGFGGGICTCGLAVFFCVWCAPPSRNLWQILCLAGVSGFAMAIGIHPLIGYVDPTHLAPAVMGGCLFLVGLALCYRPMMRAGLDSTVLPASSQQAVANTLQT
jgi:hypothetical protein